MRGFSGDCGESCAECEGVDDVLHYTVCLEHCQIDVVHEVTAHWLETQTEDVSIDYLET
jgi:hypothetical protein